MSRSSIALALVALALAGAACRATPTDERFRQWREGAHIKREVRGWHVINAGHLGKVGYLKTYDVSEGGGPTYPWRYVYDADWNELGFLDQFGNAYRYHRYAPSEQAQQNETLRAMRLPSDSIEANVMRILGIDPSTDMLSFPIATKADIAGDLNRLPLAGPGVVSATGDAVAPAK